LIGAFFTTRGVRVVSPRKLSKILDEASGEIGVRAVRERLAQAFPRRDEQVQKRDRSGQIWPLLVPRMFPVSEPVWKDRL
jgi:hypothetical protein